MSNKLIDTNGCIRYGLFKEIIDVVNYEAYKLETPMGFIVPNIIKKILVNQFHFFGVIGKDLMAGIAVVDLKYLTNGFFYIYNRNTKEFVETKKINPPLIGDVSIEPYPNRVNSLFKTDSLYIEMKDNNILANCNDISLDIKIDVTNTNPLRLCTRAGYDGWVYTQKTTPIQLNGVIRFKDEVKNIKSPDYMGLMDWTTGYMRRETFWNWASTAFNLKDGRSFGLNLSCGVNETSFTENAFWLNKKMNKIDTVNFTFDNRDIYKPWHILSNDKKIDLIFYPENHRAEVVNAFLIASKFTQLMGIFEGKVVSDEGEVIKIENIPGWAEDHYAKW